jgi:hypothetical protein
MFSKISSSMISAFKVELNNSKYDEFRKFSSRHLEIKHVIVMGVRVQSSKLITLELADTAKDGVRCGLGELDNDPKKMICR